MSDLDEKLDLLFELNDCFEKYKINLKRLILKEKNHNDSIKNKIEFLGLLC